MKNQLLEAYNQQAHQRDASATQPWKVEERANFLACLQREGKRSLLEIGAGPGRDSLFFQEQGMEVVCIDLSPDMVRLCRQKGLAAYVMDMAELTFPATSFDAVYALNSLLHLPGEALPGVLRQIHTLLKPGGLFYLGVYGGSDHQGIWEQDTYTPRRFFAFYSDAHIQQIVGEIFEMLAFRPLVVEPESEYHFQSFLLRKQNPDNSLNRCMPNDNVEAR